MEVVEEEYLASELNLWWLNRLILLISHFQKYQGGVVEQTGGFVVVEEVEDE